MMPEMCASTTISKVVQEVRRRRSRRRRKFQRRRKCKNRRAGVGRWRRIQRELCNRHCGRTRRQVGERVSEGNKDTDSRNYSCREQERRCKGWEAVHKRGWHTNQMTATEVIQEVRRRRARRRKCKNRMADMGG
jgi:hypothetical protein